VKNIRRIPARCSHSQGAANSRRRITYFAIQRRSFGKAPPPPAGAGKYCVPRGDMDTILNARKMRAIRGCVWYRVSYVIRSCGGAIASGDLFVIPCANRYHRLERARSVPRRNALPEGSERNGKSGRNAGGGLHNCTQKETIKYNDPFDRLREQA